MNSKIYSSIVEIKNIWEKLYYCNMNLSWFQSYGWNKVLQDSFYHKKYLNKNCQLNYFVCDENFIAPIVIKKNKIIEILGTNESSDYLSFIFSASANTYEITKYLNKFFEYYHNYKFNLDRINEQNIIHNILSNNYSHLLCKEEKLCVYIPTYTTKSIYFESLSKSSRQNYRTAINRLKKDSLEYNITINYEVLSKNEVDKIFRIYSARRADCDGNINFKNIIKNILNIHKFDVLSEYSKREKVFLATIRIGGIVASFCEGNFNNRKDSISIARVATNPDYYKYSPGNILIIGVIERLKSSIKYFDLTRGCEEYKLKLGGQIHYNYLYKNMN